MPDTSETVVAAALDALYDASDNGMIMEEAARDVALNVWKADRRALTDMGYVIVKPVSLAFEHCRLIGETYEKGGTEELIAFLVSVGVPIKVTKS